MLVHICCSVDSHYFLKRIREEYPDEKFTGFFYDPNIHPYSEYRLRLLDVQHSCDMLGIELIEGEYDIENWLNITKGLENEPEKGDRCTVCFDNRLERSIEKAIELGDDKFTTTLLISPKKSQEKLDRIGNELAAKHGLEFIFKDYRSGSGMQEQAKEVKDNNLYRQNYCGCLYALNAQRDIQDKLADELISPISQQILPESIEERLELYEKRNANPEAPIIKQRFLNYRLLNAKVVYKKEVIPAYFLCYSTLKNKKTKGKIERVVDEVGYLNRDEVKIITIDYFNLLASTDYKDIYDLTYSPLKFEEELKIRDSVLLGNRFDLSTVIVLDGFYEGNIEVFCDSKIYDDVREVIL